MLSVGHVEHIPAQLQLALFTAQAPDLAQTEVQINKYVRPPLGNDLYGAYGRDFATSDGRRVMTDYPRELKDLQV